MPKVYRDNNERKYAAVLRNINGEMKMRRISIKDLAGEVNMDRTTLSKKLTGLRALTVPELIAITKELEIGVTL